LTTTALTIISLASSKSVEKKRQDDSLGSLALQTVLAVIAPVAIGGFTELFSGFFKPNMEKQVKFITSYIGINSKLNKLLKSKLFLADR